MTSSDIVCSQGPGLNKKMYFKNAGCTTSLKPVVFACLFWKFQLKICNSKAFKVLREGGSSGWKVDILAQGKKKHH